MSRTGHSRIRIDWQRLHDSSTAAPWLVTLGIPPHHAAGARSWSYPQARAVIDDFGNLVVVTPWL